MMEANKYGTFTGVFIPSILTILGVILYLRAGWVVANVGLWGSITILTMASLITFATSLSMSATVTNMKVRGGGVYFMISRCFGMEAGAAIGVPLFLAQACGITFYTMGFAESIQQIFPGASVFWISTCTLVLLAALAYYHPDLAMKGQVFIFLIIMASIMSFLFGGEVTDTSVAKSFKPESFWVVFAVFFPAVTGITTGLSMSGDLKNPQKSLPYGTLLAVLAGFAIYLTVLICLDRYASPEMLNADNMIITSIAIFPPLIYLGIWCSTLSSAMGSLLAGPRTLQSMAQDGIGPAILAKGYGASHEPRMATMVTFLFALAVNFLGGIDSIAPILTMFFLTSYGSLNLAAGLEGLTNNPSWRPTFNTPWSISLLGGIACLIAMLLIDAQAAFISILVCFLIFLWMGRNRSKKNWSDIRRGLLMHLARYSIYKLVESTEDVRAWRPNMLVISGKAKSRQYLIEFANAMSQGRGFLIVASIISRQHFDGAKMKKLENSLSEFLKKSKIQALTKIKSMDNYIDAVEGLATDYGMGTLTPNTVVMHYTDEAHRDDKEHIGMAQIVRTIYRTGKNIILLKSDQDSQKSGWLKKRETIDVWWGRDKNNATLMLALGYMLQTSANWMGSNLCLRSLAETEEEKNGMRLYLEKFVQESRIKASVDVYMREKNLKAHDEIYSYSQNAGIVFLSMLRPDTNESVEQYSLSYEKFLKRTDRFPKAAFVLAGEDLDFKKIFL